MKGKFLALLPIAAVLTGCGGKEPIPSGPDQPETEYEAPVPSKFFKGTTMCFASYMQGFGLVYRENGSPKDPYESVKAHGGNIVRLQLDQVSFPSYEGVTIDWQTYSRVKADAIRAKAAGLEIFLTLKPDYDKFSDSSADHNNLPPAWAAKTEPQLGALLHDWVYTTLENLAKDGILPAVVAVGNEINVGFLKPSATYLDGSRTGRLLTYAHKAVREYAAKYNRGCLSAVHIADPSKADSVLSTIEAAGAKDYDIIALSYYPGTNIGHKLPYNTLAATGKAFKSKFGKPIMVVETAYSFTDGNDSKGAWAGDWCNNSYNYPDWNTSTNSVNYTPSMQRKWLKALAEDVKAGGGVGLITWGTESLPDELAGKVQGHGKGLYTYPAAWAYGSTWENNSYWDFTDANNLHEGIDWMGDVSEKLQ